MRAIWIGAATELMDTVLLSLQSRWPDAQIRPSQLDRQLLEWVEQGEIDIVFARLSPESAASALTSVQAIRNVSRIPILAVTENCEALICVKALFLGCDRIIGAERGPMEIQAHTVAVMRREHQRQREPERSIQMGAIEVLPTTHEVYVNGQRLRLTPTEFLLLEALMRRQGSVATHITLQRAIWGENPQGNGNVLRKYVQRLRKKLGDDVEQPRWIMTVPSIGYRMLRPAS